MTTTCRSRRLPLAQLDGELLPPDEHGIQLLSYDCPEPGCDHRVSIWTGPQRSKRDGLPVWQRSGPLEALTLTPSVHLPKAKGLCGHHAWIRDGRVVCL